MLTRPESLARTMIATPGRCGRGRVWPIPRPDEERDDSTDHERSETISHIAARLLESDVALSDPQWRRNELAPGLGAGVAFIFEDHSEIPLSSPDSHTLEYRMSWFARETDIVGLAGERVPAFERYLAEDLALGRFEVIETVSRSAMPLALRLGNDPSVLHHLAARADSAGGLTLVPYISSMSVWRLGERLAELSGQSVRVVGPPPHLTDRVNNKLWFAQRVRELLGTGALPATHVASDERELTTHIETLAPRGGRLVVKVPSGSGGRGIVTFDASVMSPGRAHAMVDWLQRELGTSGWDGSYPLVVGEWDAPVIASPSVQAWIPDTGSPIIGEVFDQVFDAHRFVGACVTELPIGVQTRLRADAAHLAELLQRLGYFGPCSFDSVLVGSNPLTAKVHWLECNGRWGGVSTALAAVRRCAGIRPDRPFVVLQSEARLAGQRTFDEVLKVLGDEVFQRRSDGTGALILSPRRVMSGAGLNLVVVARSQAEARDSAVRILARFS
ncbi:MAG TPA: hypothetical protein VIW46_08405 [Acidimicrobiia bacterium]